MAPLKNPKRKIVIEPMPEREPGRRERTVPPSRRVPDPEPVPAPSEPVRVPEKVPA